MYVVICCIHAECRYVDSVTLTRRWLNCIDTPIILHCIVIIHIIGAEQTVDCLLCARAVTSLQTRDRVSRLQRPVISRRPAATVL